MGYQSKSKPLERAFVLNSRYLFTQFRLKSSSPFS